MRHYSGRKRLLESNRPNRVRYQSMRKSPEGFKTGAGICVWLQHATESVEWISEKGANTKLLGLKDVYTEMKWDVDKYLNGTSMIRPRLSNTELKFL